MSDDAAQSGSAQPESARAEIRKGIADALPVAVGMLPLGLAFGVLMVQSGFDWWWTPAFSILIYAGSMEFLAIGLFLAATPIASLGAASLLVNFRHIFYGLSFPLHLVRNPLAKAYSVYALTDETYAIVSTKPRGSVSGTRAVTVAVCCQLFWVLPGIVGALAGGFIPESIQGFEFALTALFTVLAIDAIRANAAWWPPAAAATCGLAALLIAPEQMLVIGLAAYVVVLVAVFAVRYRSGPMLTSGGRHDSPMTSEGE